MNAAAPTIDRVRLHTFLRKPFHDKLNTLGRIFCQLKCLVYYKHIFGSFGSGSTMRKPLFLSNPGHIHIGRKVAIRDGVRLEAIVSRPNRIPHFVIGDGVNIEQRVQIICHCKLIIGNNAGIGPHCFIMDTSHPFLDVHNPAPIHQRLSDAKSFVEIGEGALLGAGTFVMPNVRIGKKSIIGANSVVRKSIPDYCVAAGNPAVVTMRYDFENDRWKTV